MANEKIETLNGGNFDDKVLKSDKPFLVDFWAEWCGPCKQIAPILDQIAEENPDLGNIGKVNIDEDQELASKYGIRAIPTLLIFHNGSVAETLVGMRSKDDIVNALKNAA
jgi:thioredoxin 1